MLELPWNSKLLFADRISALSRFDFSGKDFKGGIDCTAPTRELGVISSAARPAREGKRQLGTNLGIDEGRHGRGQIRFIQQAQRLLQRSTML